MGTDRFLRCWRTADREAYRKWPKFDRIEIVAKHRALGSWRSECRSDVRATIAQGAVEEAAENCKVREALEVISVRVTLRIIGTVAEVIGLAGADLGEKLKVVRLTATMLELPRATAGKPPVTVMALGMSVIPPVDGLLGPNGLALITMGSRSTGSSTE